MRHEKPHMVLHWIFDIPNQTLCCDITDDLSYEALEGGMLGYNKTYKGQRTHITAFDWSTEKQWISNNFGHITGYYQWDASRVLMHPVRGEPDPSPNGVGPDGRYLDHMQRMQIVLEGYDCALIGVGLSKITFVTPDRGVTVFKRLPTRDVYYDQLSDPDRYWPEHPQPCMMQPRTPGVRVSSHAEMRADGITAADVLCCEQGLWSPPPAPELQRYYIYPSRS